jgi:SAM-dependent MidA family methyltransferase
MSAGMEALLRERIERAGGWLAFDEFMAVALYAPGLGYYSSGRQTFGLDERDGSDFVTAPEMSPLFARCLARQLAQALVATGTDEVFEFGAGSGALALALLGELEALGRPCRRYTILDLSGSLQARQRDRLAHLGEQVRWLSSLPDHVDGIVIGNEVLDAMPVKLLHFDGRQWMERGVMLAADPPGLQWSDRPTLLRPPYDHGRWVSGTVTEIHPQARDWVRTVGGSLRQGALFLIDYGFGDSEYYHPQRLGGTLMCHHRHRSDDQPLVQVGEKDITAHVNFTAIALAGQDAGLEVLGYTSQGRFLLNCGIADDLAQADVMERTMAQRLINEHEMGELFKVIAFATCEQVFDAIGFREGDRTHRL